MKTLAAKNPTTELLRTQISPESALAVVTEDYEGVDVVRQPDYRQKKKTTMKTQEEEEEEQQQQQ